MRTNNHPITMDENDDPDCFALESIAPMRFYDLRPGEEKLILAAKEVIAHNFIENRHTVGSAVLCASGRIYTGVNIKGAAYGLCAEPVAIGSAISHGEREIQTIVTISLSNSREVIHSPCGNCRQLLINYFPNCMVILSVEGKIVKLQMSDLLPQAFTNGK